MECIRFSRDAADYRDEVLPLISSAKNCFERGQRNLHSLEMKLKALSSRDIAFVPPDVVAVIARHYYEEI
jgi:hypothetical protein